MNGGRLIPVIGIIIMFIGVGIHPAFAVDFTKSIVNNTSEKDCNCEGFDDKTLIELENQLKSLEIYSKLLLVLSRYNPELTKDFVDIFELNIVDNYNDFPIICSILEPYYQRLWDSVEYYLLKLDEYTDLTFEASIVLLILAMIGNIIWVTHYTLVMLGCDYSYIP